MIGIRVDAATATAAAASASRTATGLFHCIALYGFIFHSSSTPFASCVFFCRNFNAQQQTISSYHSVHARVHDIIVSSMNCV